ncbi:M91 family zinc metallopeptidase [Pseudomonas putida]|uniref:Hemolysin-like protein n=1 Tax=Pseudomonas putida TaxID=303 RepID=A0A6I6XL04_PSEPU|nr:M91 family zinc metallopeptidase [Pseudomonas putida]QHG66346.1 hemolysin-like protein [Pseudomonas putida]
MHPNPIYFISGRSSGFQQFIDPATEDKDIHKFYEYRDEKLDILLEQVWFEQGQIPGKHHMVIESHEPGIDIEITTYDCHLMAQVGTKLFVLAPTRRQTLIIRTADGSGSIKVAKDVKTPVIIQAGNGNKRIDTGGGITQVFSGTGDTQINVGQGLTFIKGAEQRSRITGHILVDDPHDSVIYARNQPGDARFEQPLDAPLDTLGSDTFRVLGSDTFKEAVQNHLKFLRHTRCGQRLLEELTKRSWIKIIESQKITHFDVYISDPTDSDHHLSKNSSLEWVSGFPAEGGELWFNLTHSDSDNLPLFDFYRCLCEAYNAFNGTTVPGTTQIKTIDRRQITVARAQLQAIGLPTGLFFDFDENAQTPPTDTNPSPFNENALREELGLSGRAYY